MNAPFANIFMALQAMLKNKADYIKHIDQDLGQLKSIRPPVAWPCVLIDFEDFSFENLSENVQTATGVLVFKLGFAPYSHTTQTTPVQYAEKALRYYEIEWALHQLLQGWAPLKESGKLCRISTTTQKRSDHYRVREIRYSIAFEDHSTQLKRRFAPTAIVLTEQMG